MESIPAYPTFSSEYYSSPNLKKDPLLFQNKKLRIEYLGNSIDKKGNDVEKKFAEVIINLKKLKGLNLANIFKKNRWDLVLENVEFKFDKFPDGVDGYVGDYGDIEDYTHRQSIGIDIDSEIIESNCPFCDAKRQINLKDMPKKGESINWFCEECEESADFSLPDESYACPFCNKDYNSLAAKMKHIKVCKERLKNIIKCPKCKLELTLDEKELQELEKNDIAKISCPCKNKFSVKRKNGKLEIV